MADRILVTGAGGFIGARLVEVLHGAGGWQVVAGVRRWSTAARVARLGVELSQCDIRSAEQVARALSGVTHLVHCAVTGDDPATIVAGTRVLMEGALEAGVKKVVHLSTVDVYGRPEGEVVEDRPYAVTGRVYGDSKIEAEQVVRGLAARGLPVTILRPTLVHGPFGATFTIAYAQRLQARPWLVPQAAAQGICNLVYVDDLVGAIIAALESRVAPGDVFNINGPERPTWNEYFQALNGALGLPPLAYAEPAKARFAQKAMEPVRVVAKATLRALKPQIMAVYQRSELARRFMKAAEARVRNTPNANELEAFARRVAFSNAKAERLLGYRPRFPMQEALPLTAAWLRASGFVLEA
ncbi:MAG TPA: NAD-dependent epimerase/dehydratase family protein [Burkholderiales bacterium]|nr:NAD-dependent epimerase/dehydratase family protein [Burkholderiales bacterium]